MRPLRVFIIQPFGTPHADKFRGIVEKVCDDADGAFEAFSAIGASSKAGPRLQDRIDSYIKTADICVADLTGVTNHNSLLEVGAAYTLNIPVIPVSDKELPSDIRGNLWVEFDPSSIDNSDVEDTLRTHLAARLAEAMNDIGRHHRNQFISFGYESRRVVDFSSLVRRCERRIDILTTNLGFVVNEKLASKAPSRETLLQMVAESLKEKPPGFRVRVLALHPDSNFTNERALGLGRDRSVFREHMREDLKTVKRFTESEDCVRSVQIKTYDAVPLQMTYFFDDIVVASVVSTSLSSRDCITYVHSLLAKGANETYERHFDHLWGTASVEATSSASEDRITSWKTAGG